MSLIKCPECCKEISDKATSCPNCGYPISQGAKPAVENLTPSENVVTQYETTSKKLNVFDQKETNFDTNLCEQSSPPPQKKKKLKVWQKILIGVGGFVAVLPILFIIFIIIPAIKTVNAYEAISPYLNYVGSPHLDEDEAITLTENEYNNIENVEILGMRGKISFKLRDGYISSCTWTSFDFCSEEEYRAFAKDLNILFSSEPDVEAKSYGNGNTYRYFWTDPYYGFAVTMAHGFYAYDPEGQIEIRWETSEEACDILGHTWVDATCIDPKTCHVCGVTEGKATGHQGSESSEWDIDYDKAANVQKYCCTICGEVIELQTEPITTFISGDHFTIYPAAFADRFEDSSSRLNDIDYYTKSEYNEFGFYDEDNTVFYRIQDKNDDYEDIGMMSFNKPDGKTVAVMNNYTENCVGCINILIEDSYDVSAIVYSAILAIDPDIGYSEAADVGQDIVDGIAIAVGDINEEDFQGINYNGINYLLYRDREYHYHVITLGETVEEESAEVGDYDELKDTDSEIEKELEMVENLFSLNYKEILSKYPNAKPKYPDGDTKYLCMEENFAGLSGLYDVCVSDDGTVWRVIFEPDDESLANESVVELITASLGDYIDYDSEWNYYTYKTDNLEIAYWIEERTYFDWIGKDLEVKEIKNNENEGEHTEIDDYDESKDSESEIGVVEYIHTAADIPNELMNDEFKSVIDLFSKGFSQSGLDISNATKTDEGTYIFYFDGLEFLGDSCEGIVYSPCVIYDQDAINNNGTPYLMFFAFANPLKSNGYKETVEMVEDIAEALDISDEGLIDNNYSSSSKLAIGEYATFTFSNLNLKLAVSNTDGTVEIEIVPVD